jgi:hypothetical protein
VKRNVNAQKGKNEKGSIQHIAYDHGPVKKSRFFHVGFSAAGTALIHLVKTLDVIRVINLKNRAFVTFRASVVEDGKELISDFHLEYFSVKISR